jgi:DNA repair ATPase RecN
MLPTIKVKPMLTTKDITKIIEAFKGIFYTKEEMDQKFEEQSKNFSNLQSTVDGVVKSVDDLKTEVAANGNRISRVERKLGMHDTVTRH